MPKKSHHISNVINIKIDTTKKTKKRKSKRKKHSQTVVPHSIAGYSSLTPYPPLTNKPYYMETSSLLLNPQLQIQDVPKPTSQAAFQPPPPPPALTDHSNNDDNSDNDSEISGISHNLSLSRIYALPPSEFRNDHIPPPTGTLRDQYVGVNPVSMFKTDYEYQMQLGNRRAKYAEGTAEPRQQKIEQQSMQAEDGRLKQHKKQAKAEYDKNRRTKNKKVPTTPFTSPRGV